MGTREQKRIKELKEIIKDFESHLFLHKNLSQATEETYKAIIDDAKREIKELEGK